jgi:chemotaxis protein histidine kinase CheA
MKVNSELFRLFIQSLAHVFRNAVDHGIEHPEIREELGKKEFGAITCKLLRHENSIDLEIDALRQKAQQYVNEDVSDWSLTDLVFTDGISSRDVASDISGRGIGMAAVKAQVERLGGEVITETIANTLTKFKFTMPLSEV